jgi:hypothetical protein
LEKYYSVSIFRIEKWKTVEEIYPKQWKMVIRIIKTLQNIQTDPHTQSKNCNNLSLRCEAKENAFLCRKIIQKKSLFKALKKEILPDIILWDVTHLK